MKTALPDQSCDSPDIPSFLGDNDLGEGEFYYYNARWYDPQTGKFISEDPIRAGSNWFAYCNNNPINLIDPSGLDATDFYTGLQNGTVEDDDYEDLVINDGNSDKNGSDNGGQKKEESNKKESIPVNSLEISYYNNSNGPITIDYNNQEFILGKDLDFGSMIPLDATVTVPEGSNIELVNVNGTTFAMTDSTVKMNEVISSYKYEKELSDQKAEGAVMMGAGIVVMGGSIVSAAAVSPTSMGASAYIGMEGFKSGALIFATGLNRYSSTDVYPLIDDIRSIYTLPISELEKVKYFK